MQLSQVVGMRPSKEGQENLESLCWDRNGPGISNSRVLSGEEFACDMQARGGMQLLSVVSITSFTVPVG